MILKNSGLWGVGGAEGAPYAGRMWLIVKLSQKL